MKRIYEFSAVEVIEALRNEYGIGDKDTQWKLTEDSQPIDSLTLEQDIPSPCETK